MSESNITEESYRLLAQESQDKFNEMNSSVNLLKREMTDMNKMIVTCYGLIRTLDNLIHESESSSEVLVLSELTRTEISNYIEENILT